MNIIYVKLGIGTTQYRSERIGLEMDEDFRPAAAVNYDDMDYLMTDALIAEVIIQISESEYYAIITGVVPPVPPTVDTNYLLTLSNYITGCPLDGDAFFLLRANVFYKVSWGDMKACIGNTPEELWRVGTVGKPAPGDQEYTSSIFAKRVDILVNSLKIYEDVDYDFDDPADLAGIDYYIRDPILNKITRPAGFGSGELIDIKQKIDNS